MTVRKTACLSPNGRYMEDQDNLSPILVEREGNLFGKEEGITKRPLLIQVTAVGTLFCC
jgi:hypothetical protein